MRDFIDDLAIIPLIVIFLIIAAFFCGASLMIAVVNYQTCNNLGEVTKRKVEWRWFGGCYVEHNGEMIPYEKWQLRNITLKDGN